jgi:hypothetical protein
MQEIFEHFIKRGEAHEIFNNMRRPLFIPRFIHLCHPEVKSIWRPFPLKQIRDKLNVDQLCF